MRTIYCGKVNKSYINKRVKLCGWINNIRNLGKLIFVEIRDLTGVIQIVFNKDQKDTYLKAKKLKNEFCVQITGIVNIRPINQINNYTLNGNVEIVAKKLIIFNKSDPLPINNYVNSSEENKLKFRYLHLRNFKMMNFLIKRSHISSFIRNFMEKEGFINIETPILVKNTPEGARDYLIPSRIHKGKFYALPQSPQIFKQLLMISGFDKYYQIAKCFRDEDIRHNRQPEFTQIDIEMSFVKSNKVLRLMEKMIRKLWNYIINVDLKSFPKIKYNDAIDRFGSDKPDLRNPLELVNISNLVKKSNFEIFSITSNSKNGKVSALLVPKGKKLNYKEINNYIDLGKKLGVEYLEYIEIINNNIKCSDKRLEKFLEKKVIEDIILNINLSHQDIAFLCADKNSITLNNTLSLLRTKLGEDLKLINKKSWAPLWIVNFPMFKYNCGKLVSMNNPFTSPKKLKDLFKDPINAVSDSYDMIINGQEVGSGSARINNYNLQKNIFNILGIKKNEQEEKFGFFINSLKYGTPPHAGFAFGLDRLVMLLTNTNNIRDVIAFPKTSSAFDLLINAPSKLSNKDISDLSIKIL